LEAANNGDRQAAAELLPLVYTELRQLAGAMLAHEKPGQTLYATALVHEAYLRLVGGVFRPGFAGRRHFLAAAAVTMRRIRVDVARKKQAANRGGAAKRFDLSDRDQIVIPDPDTLLAMDDGLIRLEQDDAPPPRPPCCVSSPACRSTRPPRPSACRGPRPFATGPTPGRGSPPPWATVKWEDNPVRFVLFLEQWS
jgi:RNA polymerase sigma factor (TIGR02999 family)